MLGNVFNNSQIRSINIENQRLTLGPKGFVLILSLEMHDSEPEPTTESSKKSLCRKHRELDIDVFETHMARPIRRLVTPELTQSVAQAIAAAHGLTYVKSRLSMQKYHGVRLANGAQVVGRIRPFELLFANLSRVERTLPDGLVISVAPRNPLAIVTPEPSVALEVALALNIAQVHCQKEDSTGVDSREKPPAVDRSQVVSSSENCKKEELETRSDWTHKVH